MGDIIDSIRNRQRHVLTQRPRQVPPHRPEMLYIGCVDARLDPIEDIGIKKGKALIFRNIAALVRKRDSGGKLDPATISETGEIPENVSMGAVLEFFINHLPKNEGKVKHIVVSGHTDCGGMRACQHGQSHPDDHDLPRYLNSCKKIRDEVMTRAAEAGWNDEQALQALGEAAVRQSIDNLMSYPVVRKAVEKGEVQLHGWIIDTHTHRISEMDSKNREFKPMAVPRANGLEEDADIDRAR